MLAQKLILSYSSRIVVQMVQIAASIIVARIAGPGVLGTVAFGLAYVNMFAFVADLGFGTAHIKKLSEGNDEAKCIGTFARIKAALVFLYVSVVTVFFLIQKYIFHTSFESRGHVIVIFVLLAVAALNQIYSIAKTTFAGYTQQAKTDLPNFIQTLLLQIIRIITVVLGYRAIALAIGNLFATIMILPVIIFLFKNYSTGPYDKVLAKEYFKIAVPVMLTGMTSTLYSTLDKVLLQFFTNSEQVGYYTAGFRVGGFVLLIANSIGLLFFPLFSKAASEKDYAAIKRHIEKFERFSFVYIMPFLILITLFAKDIVFLLLGSEYASSIPIMMWINIAMFLRVLTTPYSSVIVGLGYFNKGLQIGLWHFTFFLLILLMFINPAFLNMSGFGASIAILVSNLFMLVLYRVYAKKYISILSNKHIVVYTIYYILNFGLFYSILKYVAPSQVYIKIIFIASFIIITYLTMFLFHLVRIDDLEYLKKIFDLQSLGKYVKEEIKN